MNNILHIYGQAHWRLDVWIAGDREGLLRLRQAVNDALGGYCGSQGEALTSVNDGEGFQVKVINLSGKRPDKTGQMVDQPLGNLGVPYYSDDCPDTKNYPKAVWPWNLWRKESK